jgi:hypothetical protein
MGLIKYGPLAAEVSGTVGGVTFARVHTGKACRAWRAPVNKRTPAQLLQRYTHSYASSRWYEALSSEDRELWDIYTETCAFTNSLGETYYLSGFNMFVRNQTIAYKYYAIDLTAPPVFEGFPVEHTLTWDFIHATGWVDCLTCDPAPTGPDFLFHSTYWFRKSSRKFPGGLIKPISTMNVLSTTPFFVRVFDTPPPGSAGDVNVVVFYYIYDEYSRISTRRTIVITST